MNGIQVYGPGGVTAMLDAVDRITRHAGTYNVTADGFTDSGFVAVSGMSTDGTWLAYVNETWDIWVSVADGGFNWSRWDYVGAIDVLVTVHRV